MTQRRKFLLGLLSAPVIVKASSLMAVKPVPLWTPVPKSVLTVAGEQAFEDMRHELVLFGRAPLKIEGTLISYDIAR